MSHDIPETKCPECGHGLNRTSTVEGDHRMRPGDFSLCIECGTVMVFMEDLRQRRATKADFAKCPTETLLELRDLQSKIQFYWKLHQARN